MHPKGLSAMTDWTRVLNDVTVAIGTARSRTAVLFTVFCTKSAMFGISLPARLPGNMTDDYRVYPGGYQPDFIEEPGLGFDSQI